MRIEIKNPNNGLTTNAFLPAKEKELAQFCKEIEIPNNMKSKVQIADAYLDEKLNNVIGDKEYNLEELNFFMKLFDGLGQRERDIFYAVADGEKLSDIKDLINLTANTDCYSLVDNFSNLNELGKNLYLNEMGAVATSELRVFDGKKYVEDLISSNPSPVISKYGFIYPNENEQQVIYNGKCFPAYWYNPCPISLCLETENDRDYLYLPCEQTEIDKALERLGVDDLQSKELTVNVEDCHFGKDIENILEKSSSMDELLNVTQKLKNVMSDDTHFTKLAMLLDIKQPKDLTTLVDSMYEFELYPNVKNAEEYGKYMICESGRFEYDENLEEYIDFKQYGQDRLSNENGAFTKDAYIVYNGYNQEMSNYLEQNLGIKGFTSQPQELKLYVPLKITTYDEETSYGYYEKGDYEGTVDPQELVDFEDEIADYIREYQRDSSERGLMEYYNKNDTVNAKVQRYDITVETVKGELMGVMVLQLNAALNPEELDKFINSETGQLSDGIGESLEQQDIDCDGRDVNISFWSSDKDWKISTAEELGIEEPTQSCGFEMKGF